MCVCTIRNRWDRVCASSSSQPPPTHTDTHSDFIDFCFWGFFSFRERAKVQQFFFFVSFVKLSLPASQSRMYVYVLNGSCCSCRFLFCNGPNKLPGTKKISLLFFRYSYRYVCMYIQCIDRSGHFRRMRVNRTRSISLPFLYKKNKNFNDNKKREIFLPLCYPSG